MIFHLSFKNFIIYQLNYLLSQLMNKFHVSNPNGLQVDIAITDVVVVLNFYFDILKLYRLFV